MKSINRYDILTLPEYEKLVSQVNSKSHFYFMKKLTDTLDYYFHSSHYYKTDIYFIGFSYDCGTSGGGTPMEVSWFMKEFATYDSAVNFICKTFKGDINIINNNEQLSLF